ncbi:putative PTS system glucose-specific enzyme II [Mycoplasmopsis columbinasalis]|uniref:Putative PTS system glucose-specific enzyme II n=2 Tax=Mycoplasmopsis columbinasalis TaxID=114880 RepID=A0A449BAY4_9BACT|nr:putative PTS system glucose-specific enzyme II [Mycoplasmopsis columbinasalis]
MALPGYVNLNELITLLGEKANITEVDATLSNLKLAIQDRQKVNLEALKNLKYVSGIMAGETKITLVVGDIAQSLKNELAKLLTA